MAVQSRTVDNHVRLGDRVKTDTVNRRLFLLGGAATLLALSPIDALARYRRRERVVYLTNTHTDETIKRVYWADGGYIPETLHEVNHLLRDSRNGLETFMDPRLLDIMAMLRAKTGCRQPFLVVSAYRSPQTNAMLRRRNRGVARQSFHMAGKAIDLRVPGVSNRSVARMAYGFQVGGVGSYRRFVHIDTGPIRAWRG